MPRIRNVQRNTSKVVSPIRRDYRARQMNMNKNDDIDEETINNEVSQEESDTFNSADNSYGDNTYNQDANTQNLDTSQVPDNSSNKIIKGPINVDITSGVRRLLKNPGVLVTMLAGVFLIAIVILIASLFQGVYQSFGIIEFFENLVSGEDDYRKEYEEYWGEICGGECDTETEDMLEAQEDFYNKLKDQGLNAHQEHMVVTTAFYGYDSDQFKGDYSEDAQTLSEADEDSEVDFEKEAGMVKKLSGAAKKGDSQFYSWLKKKDYLTKKPVYGYFLEKHNNNEDAAKDDMIDEIKQIIGEYEDKPVNAQPLKRCGGGSYWWPIGSSETTEENGVLFAAGDPSRAVINSYYGWRIHPISKEKKPHLGDDIDGSENSTYVIASMGGTVNQVIDGCVNGVTGCGGGWGNQVVITDTNGNQQRYGHLYNGSIIVSEGDVVEQGQVLAKVGTTGSSTGPHLHFEMIINGSQVPPGRYYKDENFNLVENENYFIDPENPRPGGGGTCGGSVVGDSNMQTVCLSLLNAGYTEVGVAAALINLTNESHYDTYCINSIGAAGLAQWYKDRFITLKDTYGENWVTIENQVEYFISELDKDLMPGSKSILMNGTDVGSTAESFCNRFEVPGAYYCSLRNNSTLANRYYNFVHNGCNGNVVRLGPDTVDCVLGVGEFQEDLQ